MGRYLTGNVIFLIQYFISYKNNTLWDINLTKIVSGVLNRFRNVYQFNL